MEKSAASGPPLDHPRDDEGAIVLVSCYELGQQPLGLAVPAAHLTRAGFRPRLLDIDIDGLDEAAIAAAELVAISVPMHTALRIGIVVARRIRAINPDCHIAFYGIYAALNSKYLLDSVADSCLGAEFEGALVELATSLLRERRPAPAMLTDAAREFEAARRRKPLRPERSLMPPITRYTRLVRDGRQHVVGYVESTRGCKHLCRHCPLPAVYDGRFYAFPLAAVLEDVRQLVDMGAEHITFGDADFLNGPTHALRIARAIARDFPGLTFDFTAKIEHLVTHRSAVRELKDLGCIFVVSAAESLSRRTLLAIGKGHTAEDIISTVRFFAAIGLTLRPTFVPFTPWDSLDDYRSLLRMIHDEGLVDQIDPVQYGIRLLVPPGSLLLRSGAMQPYLDGLDASLLTYRWHHPDPRMDELQKSIAGLLSATASQDPARTFFAIVARADNVASGARSRRDDRWIERHFPPDRARPPRLTESWFC